MSNFLNMNYKEVHYPLLRILLFEVNMPKEFVDEDLVLSPFDPKYVFACLCN